MNEDRVTDRDDHPQNEKTRDRDAPQPEGPEELPVGAWATLLLFAAFVVALSGCVTTLILGASGP